MTSRTTLSESKCPHRRFEFGETLIYGARFDAEDVMAVLALGAIPPVSGLRRGSSISLTEPFSRLLNISAFDGYKESGFGRETHKMVLDHYQQTKNLLVRYSQRPLGFF